MVFRELHQTVSESAPVQKLKVEIANETIRKLIKHGFYSGLGWATGVTVGFALVSTIIVVVLSRLGGLPVVGGFIANIVDATTSQLSGRTPLGPSRKVSPTPTQTPTPTLFMQEEPTIQLTPTEAVLQ